MPVPMENVFQEHRKIAMMVTTVPTILVAKVNAIILTTSFLVLIMTLVLWEMFAQQDPVFLALLRTATMATCVPMILAIPLLAPAFIPTTRPLVATLTLVLWEILAQEDPVFLALL